MGGHKASFTAQLVKENVAGEASCLEGGGEVWKFTISLFSCHQLGGVWVYT